MIKHNTASFHQKRKDKIYQELVLETLQKEDGTGNCTASLKYSENLLNIFSILLVLPRDHTTQEMLIIFLSSK